MLAKISLSKYIYREISFFLLIFISAPKKKLQCSFRQKLINSNKSLQIRA